MSSSIASSYAQNRKLQAQNGIMIYDSKNGSIPQEVYFIPASLKENEDQFDMINRVLQCSTTIAYQIYFQGIRWIMPNLKSVLSNLKGDEIKYGYKSVNLRVCYIKLIFDITLNDDVTDDDNSSQESIPVQVPIQYHNKKNIITIMDQTKEIGMLHKIEVFKLT
ncbi:hypothetical protein [Pedobacter rhodius]|uniref:Uncharacterized protein n=1 Tax=Pedobacter rhodius TaxID=3004098 RepID=A0ABT4KSH0_9SPHI|nr:hypothetical protein [Pedobacter sp. SJ11]MCZ4221877.1 hypothetical protein [Pedobacter sp. SJ11]